jgi:adenosylcobinamide kinase / adenosylcobinamide-phosphate guanylyltransferase
MPSSVDGLWGSLLMTSLLVLGGARSGKSSFAQAQAERDDSSLVFVATAQAYDREMDERIRRHQDQRGTRWRLVEEPFALSAVVRQEAAADRTLLIDCLTLWLSNILLRGDDVASATDELARVVRLAEGRLILVSNEVGLGVVPDFALGRRFRDAQGHLNQVLARVCQDVVFVVAGLPVPLKP